MLMIAKKHVYESTQANEVVHIHRSFFSMADRNGLSIILSLRQQDYSLGSFSSFTPRTADDSDRAARQHQLPAAAIGHYNFDAGQQGLQKDLTFNHCLGSL
jgi:hypothetical protein